MKKIKLIFVIICILLIAIPLVVMPIRPTTVSTENRALSQFPDFTTRDGSMNLNFFSEFEKYFSEHFAFRNELVYADARIQKDVFSVSSMDTVIAGKDGWLYYKSTLNDYLGTNIMTERDIYNVIHNLNIVQNYVNERGADFLFTVPPNKNTLYGDKMPYYASHKVSKVHNMDLLTPKFREEGINYADLFALFREEKETLYLMRDSHWNNKGALMAYNAMMDELGYKHETYSSAEVKRAFDEDGDLNRMLYTLYGKKEANYKYEIDWNFTYGEDFKSVEDSWIETSGGKGNGILLMYRDSFGNTLIPFVADQFKEAYFTKATPYGLERYMEEKNPNVVIMEKVERNIWDIITAPPIISSPVAEKLVGVTPEDGVDLTGVISSDGDNSGVEVEISSLIFDNNYYKISGSLPEALMDEEGDIIIRLDGVPYVAYHTGATQFEVYIKKEKISTFPLEVSVEIESQSKLTSVAKRALEEGDIK